MFERYTEKARRVIFFARFEASTFGSGQIEPEHLLLGLIREDAPFIRRLITGSPNISAFRSEIQASLPSREPIPTTVEIPLSLDCKRVLSYTAEEAQGLGDEHIGSEHLLLGLLRLKGSSVAALLRARGVDYERTHFALKDVGKHATEFARAASPSRVVSHRHVQMGRTVQRLLEAWQRKELTAVMESFAPQSHFWNAQGELIVGRDRIKKEIENLIPLLKLFPEPTVRDITPVRSSVALITVEWKAAGSPANPERALRLLIAITGDQDEWRIVSAHTFYLESPKPE